MKVLISSLADFQNTDRQQMRHARKTGTLQFDVPYGLKLCGEVVDYSLNSKRAVYDTFEALTDVNELRS